MTALWEDLSFPAQLNVRCNTLTKEAKRQIFEPPAYLPLTFNTVTIYQQDKLVSHTNMRETTQSHIHLPILMDYMKEKYNWTDKQIQIIDWNLYKYGHHKLPLHSLTNTVKYIHGWQNTGSQKLHMNQDEGTCLQEDCREIEIQHHYLSCKGSKWIKLI